MKVEIVVKGKEGEPIRIVGEQLHSIILDHFYIGTPIPKIILVDERYPERNPDQELIDRAEFVIRIREG